MVFEYILKQNGITPSDVNIVQNIDFGSTAAAFSGGQGDYTVEFEPHATLLEQQGEGYVVASLGEASGYVPYTAYCVRKSYLNDHQTIIQGFTNAIQKGLDYVNSHSAEEIAQVISPQFTDTDEKTIATIVERYKQQGFTNAIQKGLDYVNSHSAEEIAQVISPQFTDTDEKTIATIVERYKQQNTWNDNTKGLDYVNSHSAEEIAQVISPQFTDTDEKTIATIVERYKQQNTWNDNTIFRQESFDLLQDILMDANELEERVPYEDLIITRFSENAVSNPD